MQEEKGEELFGKCHTYMEIGETHIARGVGVNIFGHSGITFQGNPKEKEEVEGTLLDYLVIKQFRDFLGIISKNTKPFASRIGCIIFDNNLKTVRGKPNSNDILDKGHKVIKTIAEGFRDEFTQLFFNEDIIKWLNEEFEQDYKDTVISISQSCKDRTVKGYLEGQLDGYRHCRGIALRLAWLDKGLESLWTKGEVDIEELLDSAKEHFEIIKRINLKSYSNIVILLNSEVYEEILKYNIKNIRPEYVKLSLYALFEWVLNNPQNMDKIIPLTEIEGSYDTVKKKLSIDINHLYRSFSRVKDFLTNNKGYHNYSSLLEEFSLDFDKLNQSYVILDRDKLYNYAKLYNTITQIPPIPQREGNKKENEITQIPQTTQEEGKTVLNVLCDTDFPESLEKKRVECSFCMLKVHQEDLEDDGICRFCKEPVK